jgi:hypothetical protein
VLDRQLLGLHSRTRMVQLGCFIPQKQAYDHRENFERLSRDEVLGWPKPRIPDLDEVSREVILGFHNR